MNVILKVEVIVYDKAMTFAFECIDESEVKVLKAFCEKVNEKMRDAYYFDSINVRHV